MVVLDARQRFRTIAAAPAAAHDARAISTGFANDAVSASLRQRTATCL
jgi:hypothetical protein